MPQLIEFELADDGFVVAEVAEETPNGDRPIGRSKVAAKAAKGFDEALKVLEPVVASVIGKLKEQAHRPDEVQIEFGFKLSADLGAIIAKTQTEGNFSLCLTWKAAS